MVFTQSDQTSKIVAFLKRRAPFSVVERGIAFAKAGEISDCAKSGNKVSGGVRDSDGITHSVSLVIVSAQEIDATCSCCSAEDLQEQWCTHAVALLWRASELDFTAAQSGFADDEATYRVNVSNPQEVANVIGELSKPETSKIVASHVAPKVQILLDQMSDKLGLRVMFDGQMQAPALFEESRRESPRALDNLLIHILETEGTWEESGEVWSVSSSSVIETILGLAQEYPDVRLLKSKRKIAFAHEALEAKLSIHWHEDSVELSMLWCLPDGRKLMKEGDLIGTGPYWVIVEETIYRISPSASRLASIFPHSSTVTFSKQSSGPILEQLQSPVVNRSMIEILSPELQPETKIKSPVPSIEFSKPAPNTAMGGDEEFSIFADLDFIYPSPPKGKNIVYLPDREREQDAIDLLKSLGFVYQPSKRRYEIFSDAALDMVFDNLGKFPSDWTVTGLEDLKSGLKFAELGINFSLSASREHKESTGGKGLDWFDCHVSLVQNNANVPISNLFKNAKAGRERWVRLDSGAYAKVPGGGLAHLRTTLGMLDPNFRLSNTIKTKLSPAQALGVSRIEDERIAVRVDKSLETLAKRLDLFRKIEEKEPTKSFKGDLRHYQKEGLGWLSFLQEFQLGGILADEMGLGKTVQTLALILGLKEAAKKGEKSKGPVLVIAPTSVITNWLLETQKFTPKLKTLLLHGSQRKKLFESIPEHDLVITSYALLRIDRFDLEKYRFSMIILDEAQNIKNPQAATTKAAKAINAEHRLALTGTPTENRPMELWSIMDFLMPGYLGSAEYFKTHIEKPILEGGPGMKIAQFLNSRTRPFILRRTKAEVEKELPPKIESNLYVPMTQSQQTLYAQIVEEVRPKVFEAVAQKGIRGASVSILAALLRLRQVCNHPNSIDSLKDMAGFESGKFNALKELVEEALESGRKILLFSQFRGMLSIIRSHLQETGVNHLYLDGATKNRQDLIDQFNNDKDVRLFLISLKAGGLGLNLTAADTVIIYDPWWNPAVESQAVDRAHRIGQFKTVNVYRLVTKDSIEEKIMALKTKKSQIVDALINDNAISSLTLTKSDLESLFSPVTVDAVSETAA